MKQQKPIIHGRDHAPSGADPIPGLLADPGGGDTLDELILAAVPDGFWKLNESSGSVAADSSGFGQDMSTTSPEVNPDWGQPAGPPGQQTADFQVGTSGLGGTAGRVSRSWPALSGDFTAGVWAKRNDTLVSTIMGQGNPDRAGGKGWAIGAYSGSAPGTPNHPTAVFVVTGGGGAGSLTALNPLPPDVWAFLAVTYKASSGEAKLYVDGLLNDTATGISYTPVTSASPLWIGHDGGLGFNAVTPSNCTLSYAFLINRTLTGSELLAMAESTTVVDRTGYVLTLDGDGEPHWELGTIEVSY